MIWGTKNRIPVIKAEFELDLHNVIAAKASELGALVYAVGGTDNHIHLAASVPPRIALYDFIGQVKGSSSHFATHGLRLNDSFAWQAQYGVVSFDGKQLDRVIQYVKNQRQHHQDRTAIPILERVVADNPV